jgi:hypothetical protein
MRRTQFKLFDQPVFLDNQARFHVTLDTGEKLKSISLLGLNSKAKRAKGFASFPVLRYDRYGSTDKPAFEEASVVGLSKDRRGFTVAYRLNNDRFAESVILDTPANRDRLKRIAKLRRKEVAAESAIKAIEHCLEKRHPRFAIQTQA